MVGSRRRIGIGMRAHSENHLKVIPGIILSKGINTHNNNSKIDRTAFVLLSAMAAVNITQEHFKT